MKRENWDLPLTRDELNRLIEWGSHECELGDYEEDPAWMEAEDRALRLKLERARDTRFPR